jgi:CRP-like cAMP-binding protein
MFLDKKYQNVMRNTSLFEGLGEKDLSQVINNTKLCSLKSDEVLFSQQQSATDFFLLVDGRIKLSLLSVEGTEKVVDFIAPGSTFAEAIILNGMKGYPVNATALSDSNVLRINAEVFTSILHASPKT